MSESEITQCMHFRCPFASRDYVLNILKVIARVALCRTMYQGFAYTLDNHCSIDACLLTVFSCAHSI